MSGCVAHSYDPMGGRALVVIVALKEPLSDSDISFRVTGKRLETVLEATIGTVIRIHSLFLTSWRIAAPCVSLLALPALVEILI